MIAPETMRIYEKVRKVPEDAKTQIGGGRLKGFTDIRPMWRIKILTEMFGPCGDGWKWETIEEKVMEHGQEVKVFIHGNLYVKFPETDDWSAPIEGRGGSHFTSVEKAGVYVNDECWKSAETDALGGACKKLGIGADVYWSADRTKYTDVPSESPNAKKPAYVSTTVKPTVSTVKPEQPKFTPASEINTRTADVDFIEYHMKSDTAMATVVKQTLAALEKPNVRRLTDEQLQGLKATIQRMITKKVDGAVEVCTTAPVTPTTSELGKRREAIMSAISADDTGELEEIAKVILDLYECKDFFKCTEEAVMSMEHAFADHAQKNKKKVE